MRALWLSRHPMTGDQVADWTARNGGAEFEIVAQNMTYPAYSDDAAAQITEAANNASARYVIAVLPAHIAAEFARRQGYQKIRVFVPVAVPVAAEDGPARAFRHSHFEEC